MLAEIVITGPHFRTVPAILAKTPVHLLGSAAGDLAVYAFLVPFQVVDGPESLLARAVWFITDPLLPMSCLVLSLPCQRGLDLILSCSLNDALFV